MDRSRSNLDIIGRLQKQISDLYDQLRTLRNQNLALPDWIYVGRTGGPAFQNSWIEYDSRGAAFWRDSSGVVHLSGFIKNGVVGTIAFTLPAGFRTRGGSYTWPVDSGNAFGVVVVDDNGNVYALTGVNTYFSLNGVSFRAEN